MRGRNKVKVGIILFFLFQKVDKFLFAVKTSNLSTRDLAVLAIGAFQITARKKDGANAFLIGDAWLFPHKIVDDFAYPNRLKFVAKAFSLLSVHMAVTRTNFTNLFHFFLSQDTH